MKNIKKLIAAGFRVYLLDIDREFEEPKAETRFEEDDVSPREKRSYAKNKEFVERIVNKSKDLKKRINWKTINKIKGFREDGMTSEECAVSMALPLETINKYWVD